MFVFYIDLINGNESDLVDVIKEIVSGYNFGTPISEEDTNKRVKRWIDDIKLDLKQVRNDSESTMYEFDYEVLFPSLFEEISTHFPEIEFSAHAEYYNDYYGTMNECNVKYINGKLEILEHAEDGNTSTDEIIGIIRKILIPLSEEQIKELCNNLDIDESSEDIATAIFEEAKFWGDSYDELMGYVTNSLLNEVMDVAGVIEYDQNWNVIQN